MIDTVDLRDLLVILRSTLNTCARDTPTDLESPLRLFVLRRRIEQINEALEKLATVQAQADALGRT